MPKYQPLDLYFLFDLSFSMKKDLKNLVKYSNTLFDKFLNMYEGAADTDLVPKTVSFFWLIGHKFFFDFPLIGNTEIFDFRLIGNTEIFDFRFPSNMKQLFRKVRQQKFRTIILHDGYFHVGFGSFIDKLRMPASSENDAMLGNPCLLDKKDGLSKQKCQPNFLFQNNLNLSERSSEEFASHVDRIDVR